jgi:hypothetical protein
MNGNDKQEAQKHNLNQSIQAHRFSKENFVGCVF